MVFYNWDESLDTKVEQMNDEHRVLIDQMNIVFDQNEGKLASKDIILSSIDKLAKITEDHFSSEEAYMASIDYPGLKNHQFIHKDLLEKLANHRNEFAKSPAQKIDKGFFQFLKFWLNAHIKGIDLKYGNFVEDQKKSA